jgi:hypothetical protein
MASKKWLRRLFSGKRKTIKRHYPRLELENLESRVVLTGGTWAPLANTMPSGLGGVMMLLSDGSVMVLSGGSDAALKTWYRLTPDSTGSYVNGAWSGTAPMNVGRLYFGSNVLPDGRLFVVGGEYSDPNTTANWTNTGEIYDPVTDTWTSIPNFPQTRFGDDPTEVLANGKILAGYLSGPQTYLYDPTANTWTQAATKLYNDRSDEETWVRLADGSILSYDIFSSISSGVPGQAQRYIPSLNQWVDAGSVPVALSSSAVGDELGPALLLPDGRVFQIGGNNNTALYNPATNTWAAGPAIPNGAAADDAPGAILPDGQVLFTADTPLFNAPTQVYDFDPTTNTISAVTTPPSTSLTSNLAGSPSFVTRMLMLPNGQMLFSDDSNQLWVYSEAQGPQNSWRPTIGQVTHNGGTFTLTGTQLTGISEGASYGDDNEMASNYPIVQLVSSSGTDYFARTTNWTPSVAAGNTVQTTNFTEPAGVTPGAYLLSVSAAGIASNNALFVQMGAGANNITLRLDPADTTRIDVLQNGSTLLGEFPVSSFNSIIVSGDHADTTTTNTLTIDSSNGNPVPAGGLTYDGGGSNSNTLVGPGTASTWQITGPNSGALNGNSAFTGIQNLIGGGSSNTLVGSGTGSTWQITGHNSGTLNGSLTFTGMQNLSGGSGADYFLFSAGGSIDGNLNGGAGVDTLDDIAWTGAALNISGAGSTDGYQGSAGSPVGGGFDNINSFVTAQKFFVQASFLTPYTNTSDITAQSGSTNYPNSEVEPRIAVDPHNPLHMVGVYQQDRWNDGGSRGNMAAVTFNGGKTWTNVPLPGNTVNNGGFWYRNSDPWVSIGPDGTVYAISIDLEDPNHVFSTGVYVNTSHDGGLTWSAASALILDSGNPFDDKESITADPNLTGNAYAVWDRLGTGGGGPTMFSRTTDGGQTWSTPQIILDPNPGQTISNQVVVLPDGTLVNMCVNINYSTNADDIVVVRSTDHGVTWSSPILVNHLEAVGVSDPDNGTGIRQGDIIPDLAVDRNNGNVYVVWQDGRFSGFTHDDIALSESTDGGLTWSAPVKVNQTPTNIPAADQAAFTPTIAVGADGTVAVSYYDFRFNTPAPGLPTDRWIAYARPWNPTNFANEQHLSVLSFNMELAPNAGGLFVGDYEGMTAVGPDFNSFGTFFVQTVSAQDLSSAFFTVSQPPAALATTSAVASSVNPSSLGQSVTFTATVTSTTGTPTGTVSFLDGSSVLATATLDNTGAASFSTSGLALGGQSIIVSYGGDNTYAPGSSGILTQVVNQDGTNTSLTTSLNPSVVGQSVTFTATVSGNYAGSGTPGGTVTFLDGNTTLGTGSLSGGVATLSIPTLIVGSHAITALYAGDTNHTGSTSNAISQTVSQDDTSTSLASSLNPSVVGQSATFTATVSANTLGSGTPGGTVTFLDGSTTLGTGTLSGGTATFTTASLAAGGHSITAAYSGDTNHVGSTSSAVNQTVNQDGTTTALVSSVNPSVVGQSVTFTATVGANTLGSGTPGGTVTFMDGSTTLGSGTLDGSGVTSFTTSTLAVGSHSITAIYAGDTNHTGSASGAISQTVNQDGTSTSLTSSLNPSVIGQSVTFTATVAANTLTSGTPGGTVTFLDGNTTLGSSTLSGGVATFASSSLALGGHSITAVYAGDTNHTGSTSGTVGQTVNQDGTSTGLVSSVNPSVIGQSVTFTATVAANTGTSGTPSGTVTFMDGSTTLGSGTLSGGVATFTTSSLAVSNHAITAVYGGDTNHTGSTSGTVSQAVNRDSTSTALTSSLNPSAMNQSVTFTATVSAGSPGSGTPSGTVTFKDGSTTLGTGTLSGGKATFTTTTLAAGSHAITAVYAGDTNHTGSTSNAVNQSVGPTTTTLVSSLNPSVFGQSVTFTVNVSAQIAGSGTPAGSVTFFDGSTKLGSAKLNSSGQAVFTTSSLRAGSHTITAVYGGSTRFATSTSAALAQTVNQSQTTTTLSSSRNPALFGRTVTFTATVRPVAPGAGTPTGTVIFYDGSTAIGSATLTGGKATFSISTLARGSHSITAKYVGDANFGFSLSSVLNEVIQ